MMLDQLVWVCNLLGLEMAVNGWIMNALAIPGTGKSWPKGNVIWLNGIEMAVNEWKFKYDIVMDCCDKCWS